MPFCTFFHVQPKHQDGAIFVNTDGMRPYLSKLSYRAPKWALMVRLMQQERRKSPQKSIFQKTGPFGDVTETAIFGHFGHFGHLFPRQDGRPEKKFQLGSGLDQRDRARCELSPINLFIKFAKNFDVVGCC